MAVYVAVVDPLPVFQHGVAAILSSAGHVVEAPADVLAWVRRRQGGLVLLTLRSAPDWELLGRLSQTEPGPVLIALLEEESIAAGARAIRAGAQSVLPRQATERSLERAVAATMEGHAVMPVAVALALTAGVSPSNINRSALSSEQVSWLRQLAAGSTVARLASEAGYSERAMFRLLRSLYRTLGVRTRIEAIMRAQEQGWFSDIDPVSAAESRGGQGLD